MSQAPLATRQEQGNPKVAHVRDLLVKMEPQIKMAAPSHLKPDRVIRIAMTSIQRTPKLLDCTPQSLMGAVLTCTQLGLEPDSVSGMAYLIPYGDQCTLIIGYRGLMMLARRSGEIANLEARVVYANDEFSYEYGTAARIRHVPARTDPGNMVAAYAVAVLKQGGTQFEVMTRSQIDAIRNRSRASSSGPWVTDYEEMARKTVLRRLCKYLPSSPELAHAASIEDEMDGGTATSFVEQVPTRTQQVFNSLPTIAPDVPESETAAPPVASQEGADDDGTSTQGAEADTTGETPIPSTTQRDKPTASAPAPTREPRKMSKKHFHEIAEVFNRANLSKEGEEAFFYAWNVGCLADISELPNSEFEAIKQNLLSMKAPETETKSRFRYTLSETNHVITHCDFLRSNEREEMLRILGVSDLSKVHDMGALVTFQEALKKINEIKATKP